MRKQLIATCSRDKTVHIWNIKTNKLEMEPFQPSNEDCTALAFHPSGLHLLVGLTDKIICYNVRAEKLHRFKEWGIRNCHDIKFSHGGHLFAAVAEGKQCHVFDFYKEESPVTMRYDEHLIKVSNIDWFNNDMGFTTCGHDGNIYFYDLYTHTGEKNKRNGDMDYQASEKGTKYNQVANIPGRPNYECIAVGNDKKLVYINRGKIQIPSAKEGGKALL